MYLKRRLKIVENVNIIIQSSTKESLTKYYKNGSVTKRKKTANKLNLHKLI